MSNISVNWLSKKEYRVIALLAILWLLAFFKAIYSAASVWYINDIFFHCFFVLPGSIFIIWRLKPKILQIPPKTNYWALLPLAGVLLIGVFGFAGDIAIFTHFSAFATLPLLIWFLLGTKAVFILWFPLLFVMFSIPIGEELTPHLQEIAADLSFPILQLIGIPAFRNGLYIEIPNGTFVVAEACSGISFLIASIVFGSIYAYISYVKVWRQLLFFALSFVVPIIANALRVVGLILVGHFFGMEHASGADHLTFGWVFFACVLILLFLTGEMLRTKSDKAAIPEEQSAETHKDWATFKYKRPVTIASISLILVLGWQLVMLFSKQGVSGSIDDIELAEFSKVSEKDPSWQAKYANSADSYFGYITEGDTRADINVFWYGVMADDAELVSLQNRLFDVDKWSQVGVPQVRVINSGETSYSVNILKITTSRGYKRLVAYWYELPNSRESSRVKTKLYQTADVLSGGRGSGALVAVSMTYNSSNQQEIEGTLEVTVSQYADSIKASLPF